MHLLNGNTNASYGESEDKGGPVKMQVGENKKILNVIFFGWVERPSEEQLLVMKSIVNRD